MEVIVARFQSADDFLEDFEAGFRAIEIDAGPVREHQRGFSKSVGGSLDYAAPGCMRTKRKGLSDLALLQQDAEFRALVGLK